MINILCKTKQLLLSSYTIWNPLLFQREKIITMHDFLSFFSPYQVKTRSSDTKMCRAAAVEQTCWIRIKFHLQGDPDRAELSFTSLLRQQESCSDHRELYRASHLTLQFVPFPLGHRRATGELLPKGGHIRVILEYLKPEAMHTK